MSEYTVKERIVAYAEYTLEDGDMVSLPADIREEITRCRDCEHYDDYLGSCLRPNTNFAAVPDGFCAWGERRDA